MPDYFGHILDGELTLDFPAPAYSQLVQDTLGNAGDPTDGFDAELAQVTADTAALSSLLDAIDSPTGLLLGFASGVDDNPLAASTDLLSQNIADVTNDSANFAALVEPLGIAPPDTSGVPTTAGGSGLTPAGMSTCQGNPQANAIEYAGVANAGPQPFTGQLNNNTNGTWHVTEVVFNTDSDGQFTFESLAPIRVLADGVFVQVARFTLNPTQPGDYYANYTAITKEVGPISACVHVIVQ